MEVLRWTVSLLPWSAFALAGGLAVLWADEEWPPWGAVVRALGLSLVVGTMGVVALELYRPAATLGARALAAFIAGATAEVIVRVLRRLAQSIEERPLAALRRWFLKGWNGRGRD